ncbi:MAG: type II toxin-antitoxin system VapC family toxin [Acidobacteria bacterium]|nr:type II toxin-antitoxin system VapC family toxin [Acidobacteriota bacterium]
MPWAILDTNAYVDKWSGVLPLSRFDEIQKTFIIRHSSVVLFELRRGAQTVAQRRLVEELFSLAKIQWAPLADDWWRAGDIVRRIGAAQHWDPHRKRAFQNDTLIALTARRYGATVVTSDRDDFEELRREINITVLFV